MFKKILPVVILALLIAGCAKKQIVKSRQTAVIGHQPIEKETDDEPSIRFNDWQSAPELKTVYFNYDSTELRAEAGEILMKNAEMLKKNKDLDVLVEGHCDERGTNEYNLALGQQRAAVIRDYYGKLGIPLKRTGTISYGEEKPAERGNNETAWAKNRRAETKIKGLK